MGLGIWQKTPKKASNRLTPAAAGAECCRLVNVVVAVATNEAGEMTVGLCRNHLVPGRPTDIADLGSPACTWSAARLTRTRISDFLTVIMMAIISPTRDERHHTHLTAITSSSAGARLPLAGP